MICEILNEYYKLSKNDNNHRYKSWEHCYNFFKENYEKFDDDVISDYGCLNLGFYLASWGMMRGSSFLLQKDYKIHNFFIDNVVKNKVYNKYFLYGQKKNMEISDFDGIDEMIKVTASSYEDNINEVNGIRKRVVVTDTLCSKILLGVYGITPAYDRYFVSGIKAHGFTNTNLCEESLKRLVMFYKEFIDEFNNSRNLFLNDKVIYTPMKLIDMYFWQIGYILENEDHCYYKKVKELCNSYCQKNKDNLYRNISNEINIKDVIINNRSNDLKKDITKNLLNILKDAEQRGVEYMDISSGEIHKLMGLSNRIPSVCNAMLKIEEYAFEIIRDTPSGMSSTKTIRYYFNK